MTNPYYTAPTTPVDYTRARSAPIRTQWEALESAFDKLNNRVSFITAGGTANVLTATMEFPPNAYEEGLLLYIKIVTTNTGPATLNVNGLGPIAIVTRVNDPLIAGDLIAGSVETLFYVGGNFMIREVAGAQGPQGEQGEANGIVGPQGPPGAAGVAGAAGTAGRTVLSGIVNPVAGDGVNGDFFINIVSWQIFGPKALGAWPAGVNIIGPTGAGGAAGAAGPAGPAGPAGADGAGSTWAALGGKPAELVSFAALSGVADKLPYFSGIDTLALADLSPYMRALLATVSEAALISDLGSVSVNEFSPTSPGWLRLNCAGVIFTIMWGVNSAAANSSTVITYPDGGFTSFGVPSGSAIGSTSLNSQDNGPGVLSTTLTGFTVFNANDSASNFFWHAVGV